MVPPTRSAPPPPSRARRALLVMLGRDVLRGAIAVLLLHLFVFQFSLVRGSSMQPNIHDGDRLLVDRLTYRLGDVERFDIAILECPLAKGVEYVKRIVGLPGDTIEIVHGRVLVNGETLPDTFNCILDRLADGVWKLPADHYFVLGDNGPVSSDSREGWFVPRDKLRGKVRACFWPPTRLRAF